MTATTTTALSEAEKALIVKALNWYACVGELADLEAETATFDSLLVKVKA